jgi:hypothetical protein
MSKPEKGPDIAKEVLLGMTLVMVCIAALVLILAGIVAGSRIWQWAACSL